MSVDTVTTLILVDLQRTQLNVTEAIEKTLHELYKLNDALAEAHSWSFATDSDPDDITSHIQQVDNLCSELCSTLSEHLSETSAMNSCLQRTRRLNTVTSP
jgi:hypothetical protein